MMIKYPPWSFQASCIHHQNYRKYGIAIRELKTLQKSHQLLRYKVATKLCKIQLIKHIPNSKAVNRQPMGLWSKQFISKRKYSDSQFKSSRGRFIDVRSMRRTRSCMLPAVRNTLPFTFQIIYSGICRPEPIYGHKSAYRRTIGQSSIIASP